MIALEVCTICGCPIHNGFCNNCKESEISIFEYSKNPNYCWYCGSSLNSNTICTLCDYSSHKVEDYLNYEKCSICKDFYDPVYNCHNDCRNILYSIKSLCWHKGERINKQFHTKLTARKFIKYIIQKNLSNYILRKDKNGKISIIEKSHFYLKGESSDFDYQHHTEDIYKILLKGFNMEKLSQNKVDKFISNQPFTILGQISKNKINFSKKEIKKWISKIK